MNFEKMSNTELDAKVAEHIMGWPPHGFRMYGCGARSCELFRPTTGWGEAHEAIDAMRKKGYQVDLQCYSNEFYVRVDGRYSPCPATKRTPARDQEPRTVCIALLKALEAEKEQEKADA